jgi:uncharacterized protein
MRTPAFERFVEPARAYPQIWRLVIGICLVAGIYIGLISLAAIGATLVYGQAAPAMIQMAVNGSTPVAVLCLLATFLALIFGAYIAVRVMHKRNLASLIGRAPVVLHDFTVAMAVVGVVYGTSLAIWSVNNDAIPNLPLRTWLIFLVPGLIGLLFQTLAEEIFFRGYLMQQLAARFQSAFVWFVLPAIAFGLFHYDPAKNGANTWTIIASVSIIGLAAADLTRRTGSLGAAWGFHFANNIVALLLISTRGSLDGLALYLTPYDISDKIRAISALTDALTVVVTWAIIARLLRR